MVTGLYALLLGVAPQRVHEWYLAVYVDAVEWVELPNTLGMSQYGDGGIMASKPYAVCGRPFTWRKKREKVRDEVKFCSDACRMRKRGGANA